MLFPTGTAVKEEMKEYAAMLEYIADDEYKADQRIATKKPSVDLITNHDAIFQIKRYGFSARVPVSILTDFEELRVFDCTRKPLYDKPNLGVLKEYDLQYKAYLDEFDKLYDAFSHEAVVAGSIEVLQKKYLEKRTGGLLSTAHSSMIFQNSVLSLLKTLQNIQRTDALQTHTR